MRIADTRNFPISKRTAAAHVIVKEGCLREMHWHPNADEWFFVIKGWCRVTVYHANGAARTFNYVAGDVGVFPRNNAHYVENIGEGDLEFLEMFRAERFEDFSVEQWLAEVPRLEVAEHLNLKGEKEKEFFKQLSKDKVPVKEGERRKSL